MRKRLMDTQNLITVVPHPAGGWTIATPRGRGTIKIYGDRYETAAAAERALHRRLWSQELNRRLLEEVRA